MFSFISPILITGDLYSTSDVIWEKSNSSSKNNPLGPAEKELKWVPNPCVTTERIVNSSTIQNCVPNVLKDSRIRNSLILNQFLILTIGGGGNLLTLLSVPYVYYKYQSSFPYLWNPVTLLMLHLSICDMCYVLIGVPTYVVVYIYGYFPGTEVMCWVLASLRHLVSWADILTQGVIAATRCIGMLKNRKMTDVIKRIGNKKRFYVATAACLSTWVLSFFIASPIVFEQEDFGGFGYSEHFGMCNAISFMEVKKYRFIQTIDFEQVPAVFGRMSVNNRSLNISSTNNREEEDYEPNSQITHQFEKEKIKEKRWPSALLRTTGFLVPFIIINICYISLHFIVKLYVDNTIDLGEHQFDICQLDKTLVILCITYLVFAGSLVPIKWVSYFGLSDDTEAWITVLGFNWYIWAYAINVPVYIVTMKDFPKIYKLFLTDAKNAIVSCVNRTKGNIAGQKNLSF